MSVDKQMHEAARWLETAEEDLEAAALIRFHFYIPTRYPNGLPDLTPVSTCGTENDQ